MKTTRMTALGFMLACTMVALCAAQQNVKAYEVMAMPATYLIDNHGRVASTYVGVVDAADLVRNVKALVAERE